jgi:hypothetical protein
MVMKEKTLIGGILSIVSGAFGVFTGIAIALFSIILMNMVFSGPSFRGTAPPDEFLLIMRIVYGGMGVFYVLVGATSIVGGIMAVKKKHWGMALAGAIAASVVFYPVGIAAVIFVSMSQPEFVSPSASKSDLSAPVGG